MIEPKIIPANEMLKQRANGQHSKVNSAARFLINKIADHIQSCANADPDSMVGYLRVPIDDSIINDIVTRELWQMVNSYKAQLEDILNKFFVSFGYNEFSIDAHHGLSYPGGVDYILINYLTYPPMEIKNDEDYN